jgi:MHS family proline/betaine transporter-like MFS transporter
LLILLARFIQGFSIGGEYNGVIAMLSEQATSKNRGRITSFGTFLEGNGCLFAVVVMLVLTSYLSSAEMHAYGWRVAYAIGLGFSVLAFIAQFLQDESKEFLKIQANNEIIDMPLKNIFQEHKYPVFIVFCLAGYLGIAYYMFMGFMPTFMEDKLNFDYHHVMIATAVASASYAWVAPFWGMLSDKIGRRPILIGNSIGLGLLVYPVFLSLESQNLTLITVVLSCMMIMIAGATSSFVTTINELFPTNVRFSGVATGYNISNAIFGGTTPLIAGLAIGLWGTYAASYYLMFASVCIVLVIWKMPETKGIEF